MVSPSQEIVDYELEPDRRSPRLNGWSLLDGKLPLLQFHRCRSPRLNGWSLLASKEKSPSIGSGSQSTLKWMVSPSVF